MRCNRFGILLFILLLLLPARGLQAQEPDVLSGVTTGRVKILGQDISQAKQQAVAQALELAVQNAFSTLVSRQVFAANLEFLYDRLLPSSDSFVITYRVLDGMEHKGAYLVGVESKIDLDLLKKRLEEARVVRAGESKPKVLLLISEQTPGDPGPRYWWGQDPASSFLVETIFQEQLAQNRIPLTQGSPEDLARFNVQFKEIYDIDGALALARALNADLLVMGKAQALESSNRMGDARTFEGVVDLAGWDLSSGKQVIQSRVSATAKSDVEAQGADEAMTRASQDAARDLAGRIDNYWGQALRQESRFEVAVEGEDFLPRFIALKQGVMELRDMENMQPKEIGSGHAILEVVYKGSPAQFADALLLKTFEGFGIEIAQVTDEQVRIRFVTRAGTDPDPAVQGQETQDQTAPAQKTPGPGENPAQ